ncbi:helix-turn-helix domain-containing protein [Camelimonas fluminis]|uniref:Helix-turn-helix domain-containing protein n=1 Tax=Camelimonas fluminis TaxID=1576911 RepID=A0ABV7UN52_9HYPH|nr:helix-turn-helix domain-containing protein [Camelimonas fluminis]
MARLSNDALNPPPVTALTSSGHRPSPQNRGTGCVGYPGGLDRRIILQSDLDIYMVQVFASGSMTGDFDGRDVSATAGDICIQDLTQPFASQVDAGSRLCIAIPRQELERHVGPRNLHGVVLKAVWPMTRLITTYLEGLVSLQETLGGPQALAAQEALITLLASALTAETPDQTHEQAPLAVALRQRVLMFIQQNLHAKDLSPETIQRQFNVSRAHLYRAFAADGGVAKVVQDKRLDATCLELLKPENAARSITDIAYSMGFSSSNQLLRSFRARFGITPTEARHEGLASGLQNGLTPDLQAYFSHLLETKWTRPARPL